MTIESAVTTPIHPRLAYSSKEIQTTPSLAMAKRSSSVIEISSEDEKERFDGTPRHGPKHQVIVIDSDSSASDDEEPVTSTPIYVPRWLTSPTHMPTPAQRQPHYFARVRTRPSTPSHPAKNASPHTSVDSDSEGGVVRPIQVRSLTKKNE
jgi:hypothetical protein